MSLFLTIVGAVLLTVLILNLGSGEKKIQARIATRYATGDAQFHRSMGSLLGPPLLAGNRVTALVNGERIFPAMLEAIRGARCTITFETYIYWSGEIGKAFADALAERAQAGIKVHVLIDWAGSLKMDEAYLERMERAGVEVRRYHPIRWYTLARLNNRTHRKLLVVDGRVGFTGGVGIADVWQGDAQDPSHWRDTHFRLEGPAVAQMQAAFLDNWIKTVGEVLHGEDYFPALETVGDSIAQVFRSSQDEGAESVRLMYLLSIACAQRSIDIANAYFVPDTLSRDMLVAALERGVRVRIILPGKYTDSEIARRASRARWGPVLEAGAEIHEFQPTMFHCKVMVVDGQWTSVGSTNFDTRSFRLNAEANLNVLDAAFAAEQVRLFEADLARARRVSFDAWRHRPWHEKVRERAAALLRAQI